MSKLDKVKENKETMERVLDNIGIKDVTVLEDCSYDNIREAYNSLNDECREADKDGSNKKLFVYVYAAGHGNIVGSGTKTQIALNESESRYRYYSL